MPRHIFTLPLSLPFSIFINMSFEKVKIPTSWPTRVGGSGISDLQLQRTKGLNTPNLTIEEIETILYVIGNERRKSESLKPWNLTMERMS